MPWSASLVIAPEPTAPHDARWAAREHFSQWGLPPSVVDDALLSLSEMVSNALIHAGSDRPLSIELVCSRDTLYVAVIDGSSRVPRARPADPQSEGGRGLHILAALSDRWGTAPFRGGKRVWVELRLDRADSSNSVSA